MARRYGGEPLEETQAKKSDQISAALAARIVRGDIAPGEKLRQDEFAQEFGVSQGTVREAFMVLAAQGLAVSLPRRGMCVAEMNANAVEELALMRGALEPLALQHSVPYLGPAQIAAIEQCQRACDMATNAADWEDANRAFHMAVIAGCPMARLVGEVHNLQLLYAWHFNARLGAKWRQREDPDHAAILSAIKARDAARAAQVMRRHLARLS